MLSCKQCFYWITKLIHTLCKWTACMMYCTLLVDGIQPNTRQMVFTTAKAKFIVSLKKERRRKKKMVITPGLFQNRMSFIFCSWLRLRKNNIPVLSLCDIRRKLIRWQAGQNKCFLCCSCHPFCICQFKSHCLLCGEENTVYLSSSTTLLLYKCLFLPHPTFFIDD